MYGNEVDLSKRDLCYCENRLFRFFFAKKGIYAVKIYNIYTYLTMRKTQLLRIVKYNYYNRNKITCQIILKCFIKADY